MSWLLLILGLAGGVFSGLLASGAPSSWFPCCYSSRHCLALTRSI